MSLRRRRMRLPAAAIAIARKTSRERIIPFPCPAQTPVWHVRAVTLRGSLPIAAIGIPLAAAPPAHSPQALSLIVLFLTTAHGSMLVHQWIYRR